jgi:hypothetical protein
MLSKNTMIPALVAKANHANVAWHFKYQPINGGPIVSLRLESHGPDWVCLALDDTGGTPLFVHASAMAWAMADYDNETLFPYLGSPARGAGP